MAQITPMSTPDALQKQASEMKRTQAIALESMARSYAKAQATQQKLNAEETDKFIESTLDSINDIAKNKDHLFALVNNYLDLYNKGMVDTEDVIEQEFLKIAKAVKSNNEIRTDAASRITTSIFRAHPFEINKNKDDTQTSSFKNPMIFFSKALDKIERIVKPNILIDKDSTTKDTAPELDFRRFRSEEAYRKQMLFVLKDVNKYTKLTAEQSKFKKEIGYETSRAEFKKDVKNSFLSSQEGAALGGILKVVSKLAIGGLGAFSAFKMPDNVESKPEVVANTLTNDEPKKPSKVSKEQTEKLASDRFYLNDKTGRWHERLSNGKQSMVKASIVEQYVRDKIENDSKLIREEGDYESSLDGGRNGSGLGAGYVGSGKDKKGGKKNKPNRPANTKTKPKGFARRALLKGAIRWGGRIVGGLLMGSLVGAGLGIGLTALTETVVNNMDENDENSENLEPIKKDRSPDSALKGTKLAKGFYDKNWIAANKDTALAIAKTNKEYAAYLDSTLNGSYEPVKRDISEVVSTSAKVVENAQEARSIENQKAVMQPVVDATNNNTVNNITSNEGREIKQNPRNPDNSNTRLLDSRVRFTF